MYTVYKNPVLSWLDLYVLVIGDFSFDPPNTSKNNTSLVFY